jgi:hypothetical protein
VVGVGVVEWTTPKKGTRLNKNKSFKDEKWHFKNIFKDEILNKLFYKEQLVCVSEENTV